MFIYPLTQLMHHLINTINLFKWKANCSMPADCCSSVVWLLIYIKFVESLDVVKRIYSLNKEHVRLYIKSSFLQTKHSRRLPSAKPLTVFKQVRLQGFVASENSWSCPSMYGSSTENAWALLSPRRRRALCPKLTPRQANRFHGGSILSFHIRIHYAAWWAYIAVGYKNIYYRV